MPKVLLLILDGWGLRNEKKDNAIAAAKTPNIDRLYRNFPQAQLKASGPAVGLPAGYMGNSEVGHLTIGAGRVLDSDLVRINQAIKNKSFFKNKVLVNCLQQARNKVQKVHLLGLLSDAGVHSHLGHLFALLKLCHKLGVKEVYVHAFLDGRDTPPMSAEKYLRQLLREMNRLKTGQLATMMGRYYAMDRDNRWNREHKAYDAMVNCQGRKASDPLQALREAYQRGETDEFVKPIILLDKCVVDEQDTVIFFNFRSDRARELTRAFVWGTFKGFKRKKIMGLDFVSLTQYDSLMKIPVAFPPLVPRKTLGEVISSSGLSQLRLAETEKWAHVTYFFNGLCECIFPHEKRIHLASQKVATSNKKPEMKIKQITSALLKNKANYDFFVVNFANADMVGHSGNLSSTKKAVEAIDHELGRIVAKFPGVIFITADHGNAEDMGGVHQTSHTINQVPFLAININYNVNKNLGSGSLKDVAPTVLAVFGIKQPKEMTGRSLLAN
ncbi:MAG TPA: 2,3-bisphosphoglycerate-independent phosphoglycerate mutase [Candidatus Nanoarchaeia archaeon]|nr:2,3-bisphosphoglycerate-independent phosphoglycerate mutase [Candidatus Nanoarchaeia archaeon]